MRIAFVGMNGLMVDFANAAARTHEVRVFDEHEPSRPLAPHLVRISLPKACFGLERLPAGERSLPFYMRGLLHALASYDPDVIVVMDFIRFWYWQVLWYRLMHPHVRVILYAETQRAPQSLLSRAGFFPFLIALKATERLIAAYFTYTEYGYRFAQAMRIRVPLVRMPVPVDTDRFYPDASPHERGNSQLTVLMVARFVAYKRHDTLLEALMMLSEEERSRVRVSFIGAGGDREEVIRSRVRALGLDAQVAFLAPVAPEAMRALYTAHDILVLPSYNEAIGMAVPEAMACGLPTITSDTVGANVYVREGVTGSVFPTGDARALARALCAALADPDTVRRQGAAAAAHVRRNHGIEQSAAAFLMALARVAPPR